MPALDPLGAGLSDDWQAEYTAVRSYAVAVAQRLPLVRVLPSKDPIRKPGELADVFVDGILKRSHKGTTSRNIEADLGVSDYLYFHLGRTHPEYGDAMFALTGTTDPLDVSPFGLGGLCCTGKTPEHMDGKCVSPIAHETISAQQLFVNSSTWTASWRDKVADFLALYFALDLKRYFLPAVGGKPTREDPERIFSDPANRDWRAWTVEVRSLSDIDVFSCISTGTLLYWALSSDLENEMLVNAIELGLPLNTRYPLLAQLPESLRIEVDPLVGKSMHLVFDERVMEYSFP